MQHRRLQRHHSSKANSAIFGVAFNPVTSKWSSFRETTMAVLSEHRSELEAHAACRRYEAALWRRMNARPLAPIWRTAPLDYLGTGLTMISAYEHGRNAAKHAKHIQACPFDTGTIEWREWCAGFHGLSQTSSNSFYKLAMAPKRPARSSRGAHRDPCHHRWP